VALFSPPETCKKIIKQTIPYKLFHQCQLKCHRILLQKRAMRKFQHWRKTAPSVNIIVGAGDIKFEDWFSTNIDILDVTSTQNWQYFFEPGSIDRILSEHCWEHLSVDEAEKANANCYKFLKSGGRLRIAVPDGFHINLAYIEKVRPGGTGLGSEDHKVLYNYQTAKKPLEDAGFKVELLEYWDENGHFHFREWSLKDGHVLRSKNNDGRNQEGSLTYTSLILDAIKP
jgi:predicted SAM-dependent methyltransferase